MIHNIVPHSSSLSIIHGLDVKAICTDEAPIILYGLSKAPGLSGLRKGWTLLSRHIQVKVLQYVPVLIDKQ